MSTLDETAIQKKSRVASFDTFRVFAILAVCFGHLDTFEKTCTPLWIFLNQFLRFCLPYFFCAAGYFFAKGVARSRSAPATLWRYLKRLLFIYVAWSLIYALRPSSRLVKAEGFVKAVWLTVADIAALAAENPIDFLFQGVEPGHLWFLVAMMVALAVVTVLVVFKMRWAILPVGALSYVIGLLGGAYLNSPVGVDWGFTTSTGPFFGMLFVAIGWWLADKGPCRLSFAIALTVCGAVLHMSEAFLIRHHFGVRVTDIDYVFGTAFYGTGVFLLIRALPGLGASTVLPRWGSLTLGVYVSHLQFIGFARNLFEDIVPEIVCDVLSLFVLYFVSLLFTYVISKIKYVRRLVV